MKVVIVKVKIFIRTLLKRARINREIKRLMSMEEPHRGSADWLARCELGLGGYQSKVIRNRVSELDPRTKSEISSGGMTGGDRMTHHNYAAVYAKYLEKFVQGDGPRAIVECGILRGTGLGVWSKLFPEAKLIGLDIDLSHTKNNLKELKDRGAFQLLDPTLLVFDQFKPVTDEIAQALGEDDLSIVIDDGYHSDETILNTFSALRPFLSRDFVFFAEDNSTVAPKLRMAFPEYRVEIYDEMTVVISNN